MRLGLFLLIMVAMPCMATEIFDQSRVLDSLVQHYLDKIKLHREPIEQAATYLFWSLCSISIVLSGINLIFKEGTIPSFFAYLTRYIIIIGFFVFLLNKGDDIGAAILDSFIAMPLNGNIEITPAAILDSTIDIASKILISSTTEFLDMPIAFLIAMCCLGFVIMSFLCVIEFLTCYVTGYIICIIGTIALGFASLNLTRYIAINYVKLLLAIGIKLMCYIIILICSQTVMNEVGEAITKAKDVDLEDCMMVLFISLFSYILMRIVPTLLANTILIGSSSSEVSGVSVSQNLVRNSLTSLARAFEKKGKNGRQ